MNSTTPQKHQRDFSKPAVTHAPPASSGDEPKDKTAIGTPPVAVYAWDDYNILLVKTRQVCLDLAHSASKGVTEILNDAEIYTAWVMTGNKPEQEVALD